MFEKIKKTIKLGFMEMFEGFTLKETLFCIILGVIFSLALFIYLAYPLLFGIVEEKSDYMTVIEKHIYTSPEYIYIHNYSRSYSTVTRMASDKSFIIKTKREISVYKLDKEGSRKFIKNKQEIKEYTISEDIYNTYKVGAILIYDKENDLWKIKE